MSDFLNKLKCRILGHNTSPLRKETVDGCQIMTPDGQEDTVKMALLVRTCLRCGQTLELIPAGIIQDQEDQKDPKDPKDQKEEGAT